MRRARSSTTRPNSVGVAPRRPRTRTGTPSSRSSWRICSETLDWTVCSTSAAAENEPASVMASKRVEMPDLHRFPSSFGSSRYRPWWWRLTARFTVSYL